jgi:hypothetical protein
MPRFGSLRPGKVGRSLLHPAGGSILEAGFAGLETYRPDFRRGSTTGDKPVDAVDSVARNGNRLS